VIFCSALHVLLESCFTVTEVLENKTVHPKIAMVTLQKNEYK